MAAVLMPVGRQSFEDSAGRPLVGGKLYTYTAGTSVPLATFKDAAQTTPNTNPIILDARGEAVIFWSGSYKVTLTDSLDAVIWTQDGIVSSNITADLVRTDLANTSDISKGDAMVGVVTTVSGAEPTTQHQVNEERTSLFQMLTPTQINAVSAELGAAAAECSTKFQLGLDGLGRISLPIGRYMLAKTQQVKNGTKRVTIGGENRIRTILSPNAADISQAPVNVNAMFVVQDNNSHFCLDGMRFYSTVAYTGVGVYAKEGGGGDASCQALFSSTMRNLWLDFASNNNGFFVGAMQNSAVQTITAENMKSVFRLEGTANADVSFTDLKAYNCFDPIIDQTADALGSALMTVDDVHLYAHNRGQAVNVTNWASSVVDKVIYEAAIGNLGSTGLFKFKDSKYVIVSNSMAVVRGGVAISSIGVDLEVGAGETFRQKLRGGYVNADIGLRLRGPGAFDLEIEDYDFSDCSTACFQIATNCSGTLRTRGCKFNRSTLSILLSTASNALNWISSDDEFIDAGLGGSAATRVLTLATSGDVVLNNPRIGRTTGAAGYFIDATGTGKVYINNPVWIGTPPTGYITGSQYTNGDVIVNTSQPSGVQRVNAAAATVFPSTGTVIVDFAGACALTLPSVATNTGRRLTVLTRQNQAVNSSAANVVPRTGGVAGILLNIDGSWAEMVCDGGNWEIVQGS